MSIEKAAATICKRTRILSGDTQSDLAAYCGCSPENIAKFERGDNNSLRLFLNYQYRYDIDMNKVWEEVLKNGE